ncbi:MAG: hypothetical protein KDD58_15795, partial [Bdellovibrionales bacterium]|nr:hypothetical protein [Bdellovibrionales bacterium]
MMHLRQSHTYVILLISIMFGLLFFQNCGEGFSTGADLEKLNSEINPIDPTNSNGPNTTEPTNELTKTERSFANFQSCLSNAAINLNNVVGCLEKNEVELDGLTQFDVDTCVSNVGTNLLDIAFCLAKNGKALYGYRQLTQWDVDNCNSKVGVNTLATCLKKNGILPFSLSQATISNCEKNVGLENIEKCLRKNGYLRKNIGITQFDVNICRNVYGESDMNIKDCLMHKELWPETLTDVGFSECRSAKGLDDIVWCMRKTLKLGPRVVLQNHIDRCREAAGQTGIANCLHKNYFVEPLPTDIAPENTGTITQAIINNCITAVGTNNIIKCLRSNGHLPRVFSKYHIMACSELVGENNVSECLGNNGLLQYATSTNVAAEPIFSQLDFNSCKEVVGTADNVIKCVRKKAILPKVVMKGDILDCKTYVGENNIFSCLKDNGYLTNGHDSDSANDDFTQANINTCITNVGVENVAKCLRVGSLASNVMLDQHLKSCWLHTKSTTSLLACMNTANNINVPANITQAMLDSCQTAVGLPNIVKCLAAREHISPIPDADLLVSCNEHYSIDAMEVCLNNHNRLPPLLDQEKIVSCFNAKGGVVADMPSCFQARGYISPTFWGTDGVGGLAGTNGLFTNNCSNCHNSVAITGGNGARFSLDNYEETKLRIDTTNWSANNSLLQKRMESNQRNNDND